MGTQTELEPRDKLMEKLKKCCDNMAVNAEMYRNLLKNPNLSEYSRIERKAKAEAWQEASEMLANIDNPWDHFGWERP